MTAALQILAVLALGAAVAFGVKHWIGFVGSIEMAALIFIPTMLAIAFIADRRAARRRRDTQDLR